MKTISCRIVLNLKNVRYFFFLATHISVAKTFDINILVQYIDNYTFRF